MKPIKTCRGYDAHDFLRIAAISAGIFFLTMLVSAYSPISLWCRVETLTDSSVFKYVALEMANGNMPYKDTFDHKGPLLYILNYLGNLISYYRGVWVIEVVTIFASYSIMYKTARLFCNRIGSFIVLLTASTILFRCYERGNLTEEYALPFIAAALYIFLDYFVNKRISTCRLILCGLSFGAVCLLRVNMIAVWLVFCVAVLVQLLVNRQPARLISFVGWFLLGFCIIVVPIFIWLVAGGAFGEFINQYLFFNLMYSTATASARMNSFLVFFKMPLVLLAVCLLVAHVLFLHYSKNECCEQRNCHFWVGIIYVIYLIATLLLICMSGQTYGHYGMVLVPALIYPYSLLGLWMGCNQKAGNSIITMFAITYALSVLVIPTWLDSANNMVNVYLKRNETSMSKTVTEISDVVFRNTAEHEKITVYGNWDIIYVNTQRLSASKYSYQVPIKSVSDHIESAYFEDIQEAQPAVVVIQSGRYDKKMEAFLNENGYSLTYAEKSGADEKKGALVYIK